jgi:tetratricopeptide (TPR) repeat protein
MIVDSERSGSTWNNIGSARQALQLSAKAATSYRRAIDREETMAMSNLAYMLLNAGFLPEAQAICDAAFKLPDYHKNVLGAVRCGCCSRARARSTGCGH